MRIGGPTPPWSRTRYWIGSKFGHDLEVKPTPSRSRIGPCVGHALGRVPHVVRAGEGVLGQVMGSGKSPSESGQLVS